MTIAVATTTDRAQKPSTPPSAPVGHRGNARLPLAMERLQIGALTGAAALCGFGLILYIAANWEALGRFGRFWLVGGAIGLGGLAALALRALRKPGLILGFAATGALLALIGQTYQTGADPWQLFAAWGALTVMWALAARSDALWSAWGIVALTAVTLWQWTQGRIDLGPVVARPELLGVHTSLAVTWALALALAALMAPWGRLERALGGRRWAFRIVVALALYMIASDAVSAVLASPDVRLADYTAGLALLAGVAAALAFVVRSDVTLLAGSALAIDAALIAGIGRLIMPKGDDFLAYLSMGIVSALIIAASVLLLMRLAGRDLALPRRAAGGAPAALEPAALDAASGQAARPWAVVLLSGVGALMAAVPFILALSVLIGPALEKGAPTYIVALVVLPLSVWLLHSARNLLVEQLSTVGLACGGLLLAWGLYRDLPEGAAGVICGILALALGVGLGRPWLAALLGAAAAACFGTALISALVALEQAPYLYAMVCSALAVAGVGVAALLANRGLWPQLVARGDALDAGIAGWLGVALAGLALSTGASFLVGAHFRPLAPSLNPVEGETMLLAARGLSGVLAAGGGAVLLSALPPLRALLPVALMGTALGLSLQMPALGATVMVLAMALVMGWRVVGIAAAVAALWIIGAFYYDLSMPLAHKAALLAGAGVVLGAVALASGARLPRGAPVASRAAGLADDPTIARGLIALGLIAISGICAQAITSREALIRSGAPVFIELVPVDPRSLMQGDYMALRFKLPDAAATLQPGARNPRAIGKRRPDGVLELTRLGDSRTSLGPDEMMVELVGKAGRYIVVTDAWYFQEGTGKKWEAARYGELRVQPTGRALLVGLADKDRVPIK